MAYENQGNPGAGQGEPGMRLGNPRLSVRNPQRWLRISGWLTGLGVACLALGLGLLAASAELASATLICVGAVALATGLGMLPAGLWSRKHPEVARQTAEAQREAGRERLRRHPYAYVLGFAVLTGVLVPARISLNHGPHHHPPAADTLLLIGGLSAVGMAVLMGTFVIEARRDARRH